MSARPMSHERCVQRVCCSSWSCTPHLASCAAVNPQLHQVAVDFARERSMTLDEAAEAIGNARRTSR